jgi:hypothetical protein
MKDEKEGELVIHRSSLILHPSNVRYQVLAVACSLAVLTYLQRQGFVAGTPYIKADLGLNDAEMGLLASVWLVAYGLFQVPGGLLGDRLGARHLLTILVVGWSLLAGAVALAAVLPPGGWLVFAFLVVLRFAFGMFQAGGFPGLARVVADWMPAPQRGFAQGMIWTFSRLGGFLAPLLVLWLFKAFGDWATPFWLLAGLGLLWAVLFWSWFRNRPEEMPQVNAAERALIAQGLPTAPSIEDRGLRIEHRASRTHIQANAPATRSLDPPSSILDPPRSIADQHQPLVLPPPFPGRGSSARATSGRCASCTDSWASPATSSPACCRSTCATTATSATRKPPGRPACRWRPGSFPAC